MDGLTYEDLAERAGVPLGTMKSWIRRGLAKLRRVSAMSDTGKKDRDGMGLTAAEYVLGVLGAEQRRAAERRKARDAAFAQEVAFREERLGGLVSTFPEVAPPQRRGPASRQRRARRARNSCRSMAKP